jgi:hypothetical protein
MSENETQQAQAAAQIPEVQLSEGELESVSGGTAYLLISGGPVVAVVASIDVESIAK